MGFPNFKEKQAKDSMFTPAEFIAYQKKAWQISKIQTSRRSDFLLSKKPNGIYFKKS